MAELPDVFAEARLRQERLLEQLAAAPVASIVGVVAPSGVSGGKLGPNEPWIVHFTLEAWRIAAGDIQIRPLAIQRAVTDGELKRLRDQIRPYAVICITARVVVDSMLGSPQGLLETVTGADSNDTALNEYAARLQEPVTYTDQLLGTFTLDRRTGWFSGMVVWGGHSVSLNLSASELPGLQGALRTAYTLWKNPDFWSRRIRDYAVEQLLPLKNANWLDEGEAELTGDQFQDRMQLTEITVNPDGSFDFWHNDGDLFWGHAIEIGGNLSEGPTHADIPG